MTSNFKNKWYGYIPKQGGPKVQRCISQSAFLQVKHSWYLDSRKVYGPFTARSREEALEKLMVLIKAEPTKAGLLK